MVLKLNWVSLLREPLHLELLYSAFLLFYICIHCLASRVFSLPRESRSIAPLSNSTDLRASHLSNPHPSFLQHQQVHNKFRLQPHPLLIELDVRLSGLILPSAVRRCGRSNSDL